MTIIKLKLHKSPGIHKIPAELIKSGAGQFGLISINLLILFGIRRNCLSCGRNQSFNVPIYKRGIKTDSSSYRGISLF